jgi:hypothetical protein
MRNLTLLLMTLILALVWSAPAFAEGQNPGRGDRPDRPGLDRPMMGGMDPFTIEPSEEMQKELTRYREETVKLMTGLRDLGMKIREEVNAEVEKENARIKAENPDVAEDQLPKPDVEAIARKVRENHKQEITDLATKLVDGNIVHSENMLALKKASRDKVIEKTIERFGEIRRPARPAGENGDRPGMGPRGGEGGERGEREGLRKGNRPGLDNEAREKIKERMKARKGMKGADADNDGYGRGECDGKRQEIRERVRERVAENCKERARERAKQRIKERVQDRREKRCDKQVVE